MLALACGAAGASSLKVNLEGSDSAKPWKAHTLSDSLTFSDHGITATFEGKAFDSITVEDGKIKEAEIIHGKIGRYPYGAGVFHKNHDWQHTVDGFGAKDFIQVTYNVPVQISAALFGYYGHSDDFRWMWDSNGDGEIGVGDMISSDLKVEDNNPFSSLGGVSSTVFAFGAFQSNVYETTTVTSCYYKWYGFWPKKVCEDKDKHVLTEHYDSWKLREVHATVAVIPLPASSLLLVAGLGGLATLRRRKR